MQFSPASCLFIILRFNYSPEHPVLFPQRERQVCIPIQSTGKIILLHILIFTFFRQQIGRQKILNRMEASIPQVLYAPSCSA
jgi:hypothetical protein